MTILKSLLTGRTLSGDASGSLTYGYDRYGNMLSRAASGVPNAGALGLTRSYAAATNHDDFDGYDTRGNVATDGAYTYLFNLLNMVTAADKSGGVPFEEKMAELSAEVYAQMAEAEELDAVIRRNLEVLGYGE